MDSISLYRNWPLVEKFCRADSSMYEWNKCMCMKKSNCDEAVHKPAVAAVDS